MKQVRARARYRLQRTAAGPFSFAADGDLLTHARDGIVFCASTYMRMLRVGWVQEAR